jgi:hypothetical protein
MELLREIAFRNRTEERGIKELKVGDLTTKGRITKMVQRDRLTILTLEGTCIPTGRMLKAIQPGDTLEVIV